MNRYKKIGLGGLASLFLCGLFLWGSNRLSVDPFLICAQRLPTQKELIYALRYEPGTGGPGVGEDGLIYHPRPLNCPNNFFGPGDPKLLVEVSVYTPAGNLLEVQLVRAFIINGRVYMPFDQKAKP